MDFRTYVFLFATLSVCINTFVCVVTTLPIPGFKSLRGVVGLITYRAALGSALLGFLYRIGYSVKRPSSWSLSGVKQSIDPIVNSNGFQYSLYCFIFLLGGRPVPTVLMPLATCAAYQVGTILNKHFGSSMVWQSTGASKLFMYAQENMHRAMMTCATMEISMLPVVLLEMFTPARSPTKVFMLVNLLKRRYQCSDNTVFRIKYTYYDSGYYHRQFWGMVGEKTGPVLSRLGPVRFLVDKGKNWFTSGATEKAKQK